MGASYLRNSISDSYDSFLSLSGHHQPFFLFGVTSREALEAAVKPLAATRPVPLYQEKMHSRPGQLPEEFKSKTGKMAEFDVPLEIAMLRCLKRTATLSVSGNSSQNMISVWGVFRGARDRRHVSV